MIGCHWSIKLIRSWPYYSLKQTLNGLYTVKTFYIYSKYTHLQPFFQIESELWAIY